MKGSDRPTDVTRLAGDAIDEEALAELLDRLTDGEVEDSAVESLRRITADLSLALAAKAATRSRYRATPIRGEDVADTWEQLCGCECEPPPTTEWIAQISVWETY